MRPVARLAQLLCLALLAAAPAIAAAAAPAVAGTGMSAPGPRWGQLESRIESGYFQQDAAALTALAAALPAGSAGRGDANDTMWRSYYAALLAYRLALLAKSDEQRAWPFTQQCIGSLNRVLVLDTGSAEALALQSACYALQSSLDAWRSPLAGPLSKARSDKALELAPHNPRVLLLGALAARERPALFGGDPQQAFHLMQQAVAAFERQRESGRSLPGWGAADAFTDLARDYLGRGETLAARNVLERALLIAPQFTQAQQLMAEIVAG